MDPDLDRLRSAYAAIAPQLLPCLLDLMLAAREACGGDVEAFIILMGVAMRTVEGEGFRALTYDDLLAGKAAELPAGTNSGSVAESLGLPRETVRRKVLRLVASGLLLRDEQGLRCAPEVFTAFSPVREALLRLTLQAARSAEIALGPTADPLARER